MSEDPNQGVYEQFARDQRRAILLLSTVIALAAIALLWLVARKLHWFGWRPDPSDLWI